MNVGTDPYGASVLDATRNFIGRFCAFPSTHCLVAVALWAAHSHIVKHFHTTPRLAVLSPEAGSGKTRVLEILDLLCPDTLLTMNASPPAIFRTLANGNVTLLFDESDAIWRKRGKDDNHEDLRALLNAGYKVGASVPRCVGPNHEVVRFPVFCAVALAGLGDLPDTIMTRSVIIRMRKRSPLEYVEPFRAREHDYQGLAVRTLLADWATEIGERAGAAWPKLPDGVVDRPAEIWEPLIAIADVAGGRWPELAREACIDLCRVAQDGGVSLGIRLLADVRTIFGDSDALYSATIIDRLTSGDLLDDDSPWGDLRGKALGIRGLARMLSKYGIGSTNIREPGGRPLKGYRRVDLWDAWQRYLPLVDPAQPLQPLQGLDAPATTATCVNGNGFEKPIDIRPAADVAAVAVVRDHRRELAAFSCPSCAGEGCRSCGDTGRNPEVA